MGVRRYVANPGAPARIFPNRSGSFRGCLEEKSSDWRIVLSDRPNLIAMTRAGDIAEIGNVLFLLEEDAAEPFVVPARLGWHPGRQKFRYCRHNPSEPLSVPCSPAASQIENLRP